MGKLVLKDAYVEIDGTDLSDRASQVAIETPADEVEMSTFGGDYHEFGQGLKDATVTVTFFQDYAATSVDAVLWPLHESGETFPVIIRPTSAVVSDDNPQWDMTGRLFNYSPISGEHGAANTVDVSIRNASEAGVVRSTS